MDFLVDISELRELHDEKFEIVRCGKTQLISLITYPFMERATNNIKVLIHSTGFRFTNSLRVLCSQPRLDKSLIALVIILLEREDLILPDVIQLFTL